MLGRSRLGAHARRFPNPRVEPGAVCGRGRSVPGPGLNWAGGRRHGSMPGNRWPLAGRYKGPAQLAAAVVAPREAVTTGPRQSCTWHFRPIPLLSFPVPGTGWSVPGHGLLADRASANARAAAPPSRDLNGASLWES
jgi:hypothetical protein